MVVWYSHLFQNFPQFIVSHTVKGFGIVNKAEIDVFLELCCFFNDPEDIGNLIPGSSAFSKTSQSNIPKQICVFEGKDSGFDFCSLMFHGFCWYAKITSPAFSYQLPTLH